MIDRADLAAELTKSLAAELTKSLRECALLRHFRRYNEASPWGMLYREECAGKVIGFAPATFVPTDLAPKGQG